MATSVVSAACAPAVLAAAAAARRSARFGAADADRLASGSRAGVATSRGVRFSRAVVLATKTKRSGGARRAVDEEEEDDDFDDEAAGFADMEEWMERKPAGFGLAPYDTALEDQLLAEIEADNAARAAAIATRKAPGQAKKSASKAAAQSVPPAGVEVYVGNLPRKRKVDRDLRTACGSARGLLHIRPVVGGNEKTRDPTCKGMAFLTFGTQFDAEKFIDKFNGKSVSFGSVEKSLTVELASPNSPYKKVPSQRDGADAPRLPVRETAQTDRKPSHVSSFPFQAEEKANSSVVDDERPNSEYAEEQGEDVGSMREVEDDVGEDELEVWAELEDEDDFELDDELEEDTADKPSALSDVDEGVEPVNVEAESGTKLGGDDGQAEQVVSELKAEDGATPSGRHKVRDIKDVEDEQKLSVSLGDGPYGFIDDKDKKIQELESKLKALQLQLSQTVNSESLDEQTELEEGEKRIEALEKRLLFKARQAEKRKSKPKGAQKISIRKKSKAKKSRSKEATSQPKATRLGAASRLKGKERQMYTDVVSKYSPTERRAS